MLYYLAPLDRLTGMAPLVAVITGLPALAAMTGYHCGDRPRASSRGACHGGPRHHRPALPPEVLRHLLPDVAHQPQQLQRVRIDANDALYFTVTVFATVGFGDISPASQGARLVPAQMILNLLVLGLEVRLILSAVEHARESKPDGPAQLTGRAWPERSARGSRLSGLESAPEHWLSHRVSNRPWPRRTACRPRTCQRSTPE